MSNVQDGCTLDELARISFRRTTSRERLWLFCIQSTSFCVLSVLKLACPSVSVCKFWKTHCRSLTSAHVHKPCRSLFRQPVKTLLKVKVACRSTSIRTTAQQEKTKVTNNQLICRTRSKTVSKAQILSGVAWPTLMVTTEPVKTA